MLIDGQFAHTAGGGLRFWAASCVFDEEEDEEEADADMGVLNEAGLTTLCVESRTRLLRGKVLPSI